MNVFCVCNPMCALCLYCMCTTHTDTDTDGSGAKESECGSQEMLSPFRNGAAHKSKTLHRKSKWEHKEQHKGGHTRTKLISQFS